MVIAPAFDFRRAPLFRGLNGCELTALLAEAQQKSAPRGSFFFHESDSAHHCHLLLAGRVKLVQGGEDGTQVVVRFVGPGEVFGWAATLGSTAYPGSAEAMADSSALIWDDAAMRKVLLAQPRLALNALEIIGGRLREAQDRLRELATERAERRIVRALLRLVEQAGLRTQEGMEINFPLSRQDLAEATGTTLHTVSRILSAYEQRGLIAGSRQRVVILQLDELRTIAEEG